MKRPIIVMVGTDLTEASDEALVEAEARATRYEVSIPVTHAIRVVHAMSTVVRAMSSLLGDRRE